ncbi:RDD family protein [Roseomonas sp. BN140053]|uniref:RDD family protein n=1 Tax=Roseomonas sp. BN140053 TaxID=3391898 RepID=UPI0039EC42AC
MSEGRAEDGLFYASFRLRLLATILDAAWLLPLGWVLGALGAGLKGGPLTSGAGPLIAAITALSVLLFWVARGTTPGKAALNLRIVDARTGGPPPFRPLLLRYAGWWLPWLLLTQGWVVGAFALALGYLWMLRDPRRQCLHDKLGGTVVVVVADRTSTARFG